MKAMLENEFRGTVDLRSTEDDSAWHLRDQLTGVIRKQWSGRDALVLFDLL